LQTAVSVSICASVAVPLAGLPDLRLLSDAGGLAALKAAFAKAEDKNSVCSGFTESPSSP
jgi:hypothetical protein